jgi:hypothetical protein
MLIMFEVEVTLSSARPGLLVAIRWFDGSKCEPETAEFHRR